MRLILPWIALAGLALSAGCGEKKPPEAAAEAAVTEAPAAPEPEPEPEPVATNAEPEPPAAAPDNVDMNIAVAFADGSSQSGHVRRIERSEDWFAEKGWTDSKMKMTVTLESGTEMIDATWDQIASISVAQGSLVDDVSCTYSSETNPWFYTCELKTPTRATLKDGRTFDLTSRHKWKLIYDDGTEVEFWLAKYPARLQDEVTQSFDRGGENTDMYVQLQDQLRVDVKTLVKSISVQ